MTQRLGEPVDATPVPTWCRRLTADLDAADARAIALARGLTIPQLNWRSHPGAWSVGQCLEHLSMANEIYVESIAESLGVPSTGPVDEVTPGWLGRWFIRAYIEPATQKKRARAPRKIVPVGKEIDSSMLDRFVASNARVRDLITRARGHDINRVRFKSPFAPLLRFTVGTGLQVIARHNHRHLLQAERVRQSSDFPDNVSRHTVSR
jgi:hypothetical protein